MTIKMTFKARPSNGWLWIGAIGLIITGLGVALASRSGFTGPFLITILIAFATGIGFLLLAAFFPTMRYELDDSRLHISYGPVLHYTVDMAEIENIRRCDLGVSVISSFRFPGLALFGVPSPEVGRVNMCASVASKGILLIETRTQKYGITPADEAAFLAELRRRMGK
jgi:hypothetical protein